MSASSLSERAMDTSQSILIVGAGPTGLTLAATLVRYGVTARIIDRAVEPPQDRSRAIVLQARTLEIFRDLEIDAQVLQRGLLVDAITLLLPNGKRASVRIKPEWIPSRFNRFLALPQDETEHALLELITSQGVVVERGVALEGLETSSVSPVALLRHADGTLERFAASWIVGADGAHSGVRHAAGIPFPGETYADEALLGDVDMDWHIPDGEVTVAPGTDGFLLAFPLPGEHRFRVIMIHPAQGAPEARALSLEEFTQSLAGMMPRSAEARAPRVLHARWLTRYRLHRRGVPTYRSGRAFVAGDAAHIHSPVGAQGMNTGIQDSYNLGWKLAMVVRGEAHASILDTYHAERHPVGQLLLTRTDQAFGILAGGGRRGRALRRVLPALGVRLLTIPFLARRLALFVSQTRIRYAHSSLAREGPGAKTLPASAPRAGDRLPDVVLETGERLHDLVQGPSFCVLCVGGASLPAVQLLAREIEEEYAEMIRVLYLPRAGPLLDFAGVAGGVYLVRPDKHIGFRTTAADATSMISALATWLCPRRGG